MTPFQFDALKNDDVVVTKTGKIYRAVKYLGRCDFIQIRDGRCYGPVRSLKAENIERREAPAAPVRVDLPKARVEGFDRLFHRLADEFDSKVSR